jgi:hypothetical protein
MDHGLTELVGTLKTKDDEEEEKKSQEEKDSDNLQVLGTRVAGSIIEAIWPAGLGRVVSGAIQGYPATFGPAFSAMSSVPTAISGAKNLYKGVDLTAYEAASLMKAFTLAFGIPVSVIGKGILINEAMKDPDEIREENAERRSQIQEAEFKDLYGE